MGLMGPGVIIYGYCEGCFGRDSYSKKVIEAIGRDWVVVRELDDDRPNFASFARERSGLMLEKLREWSSDEARERWERS